MTQDSEKNNSTEKVFHRQSNLNISDEQDHLNQNQFAMVIDELGSTNVFYERKQLIDYLSELKKQCPCILRDGQCPLSPVDSGPYISHLRNTCKFIFEINCLQPSCAFFRHPSLEAASSCRKRKSVKQSNVLEGNQPKKQAKMSREMPSVSSPHSLHVINSVNSEEKHKSQTENAYEDHHTEEEVNQSNMNNMDFAELLQPLAENMFGLPQLSMQSQIDNMVILAICPESRLLSFVKNFYRSR